MEFCIIWMTEIKLNFMRNSEKKAIHFPVGIYTLETQNQISRLQQTYLYRTKNLLFQIL